MMTAESSPVEPRPARVAVLTGLAALALVLGALGFQNLGHLPPCEMCHWQRWPHIAAALLGLAVVPLWNGNKHQAAMIVIAVVTLAALVLAWYWNMLKTWQPELLAALLVGLVAAAMWKKDTRLLAIIVIALVAISGLIGAYQTGMQIGWLPGPQACSGARFVMGSNVVPEIQCNAVTWSLFGLSLAAYNAIFSFLIAGVASFLLARR